MSWSSRHILRRERLTSALSEGLTDDMRPVKCPGRCFTPPRSRSNLRNALGALPASVVECTVPVLLVDRPQLLKLALRQLLGLRLLRFALRRFLRWHLWDR